MAEYILDREFNELIYDRDDLNHKEFENCIFINCDFRACSFINVTLIDCQILDSNLQQTSINHTKFRTVHFDHCNLKEVNFAMCDASIFEIHFKDCVLDFAKMYALKLKSCTFVNSSLIAVDFMKADVSGVQFINCDLYRAEFDQANAQKTDFSPSNHYAIRPEKTKIKKAIFSLQGVQGLLLHHEIIVE